MNAHDETKRRDLTHCAGNTEFCWCWFRRLRFGFYYEYNSVKCVSND